MEVLFFKYPFCPYCRQAEDIIKTLFKEHPEYKAVNLKRIDETLNSNIAAKYDYYYTPAFFLDGKKLYEADRSYSAEIVKEKLNDMFKNLCSLA